MPQLTRNAQAIKGAVCPPDRPQEQFSIKGVPNLWLIVSRAGTKSWQLRSKCRVNGKQKLKSEILGHFPALGLKAAIEKRDEAIPALRRSPPGSIATDSVSFEQLVELRFKQGEALAIETIKEYRRSLEKDVLPVIGTMPIANITTRHLLDVCSGVADRGSKHQASRLRSTLSSFFRFAAERQMIATNPCAGLPKYAKKGKRNRKPELGELADFWKATYEISENVGMCIRLAILTGQRRKTVAGARKSELRNLGTKSALWLIPQGLVIDNANVTRTKSGKEQRLPISLLASELLQRACELSKHDEFVFPGRRNGTAYGHIDPHSISEAVGKMCDKAGLEDLRLHDMRRSISSQMSGMAVPPHVIDEVLHHADDSTRGIYYPDDDREREVRHAMDLWARRLQEILDGQRGPTRLRWALSDPSSLAALKELAHNADAHTKEELLKVLTE